MAVTQEQVKAFQKYVTDNKIDTNTLTDADAKEFVDTGSIGRYTQPQQKQVTTDFRQKEQVTSSFRPDTQTELDKKVASAPAPTPMNVNEQGQIVNETITTTTKDWKDTFTPATQTITTPTTQTVTETPKIEPTPTETTKDEQTPTQEEILNIEQFKQAGGTTKELEQLVENRYGANATVVGDKVIAEINGERFEWSIDEARNPIKKSLGKVGSIQETYANESGIAYDTATGTFKPKDISEAMDLYAKFGKNVKIDQSARDSIIGSKTFEYLSKYKGADTDTLLLGMKADEIGTSGEVWDNLAKLNGGVTAEMLEAKRRYEEALKLSKIKSNQDVLKDSYTGASSYESKVDELKKSREDVDNKYIERQKEILWGLAESWKTYKDGNPELEALNAQVTDYANRLDEIETQKRKTFKELKAEYPALNNASLMELYRQRVEDYDDEAFAVQREYNRVNSAYNYKKEQLKWDFEYETTRTNLELGLLRDMYGVQRWDISEDITDVRTEWRRQEDIARQLTFRKEDIAREDKRIAEERAIKEVEYDRAIKRWDYEFARNAAYEMKMLDYKASLNEKYADTIKALGGNNYAIKQDWTWVVYDEKGNPVGWNWTEANISNYYGGFKISQNAGDKSPNAKDTGYKGWTPWIDIAMPEWTDVVATTDGKIVRQWTHKDYGNQIIVEDAQGNQHMYSHLKWASPLNVWDEVTAGMVIGSSGNTWFSTWPHLDYRVKWTDGKWTDPAPFMFASQWDTWFGITPDELTQLQSMKNIGTTAEQKPEAQALENKYIKAKDIAKTQSREFALFNRLLSAEWAKQGVSNVDTELLREPLADYIKTWDDSSILLGIQWTIENSKKDSSLWAINKYLAVKDGTNTILNYVNAVDPNISKAIKNDIAWLVWKDTESAEYASFLKKYNMEEVLRVAGTSFTDAFLKTIGNMNIQDKDTPELVRSKINAQLQTELSSSKRARDFVWQDILDRIYPWYFTETPTTSGSSFKNDLYNEINQTGWLKFNF